jgi:acyl-CoA reductase-like NAD-dependent aldehyde dehydrogenase
MTMARLEERLATHDTLRVTNPGTGEILDEVELASVERAQAAVDAAQEGRRRMAALAAHERAELLFAVAARMEALAPELAVLLAAENGKPILQTREELRAAIRIFRGFAEEAKRLFGRQIPLDAVPGLERHLALTIREPLGVVAAVVPFNYPVELYAHKAAAALAAGNAVVVKLPRECPLTLLRIHQLFEEAGAPAAAHQVLVGNRDVVRLLASSDGVQMVSITGSTAAGIAVAEQAARTLKHVDLELGGNDAMIVCADADVERASDAVVLGRLARGNGQICCAVKRVYVDPEVYDSFAEALAAKAAALVIGDQLEEATDVGPLIDEGAAASVEASVEQAVAAGARVAAGGTRHGAFLEPTVLVDVPPRAEPIREEIFGPVAPLLVAEADEAVELANESPFGLQASVFTRDISRAFSLARRFEVGGVVINGSSALRAENLPFGGVKLTGGTREGLHDTLRDMTAEKAVIVMDAFADA